MTSLTHVGAALALSRELDDEAADLIGLFGKGGIGRRAGANCGPRMRRRERLRRKGHRH